MERFALTALLSLVAVWLILVVTLLIVGRDSGRVRESLRLLPDLLRLLSRLARDKEVARSVRLRLWGLLAYLALPIDLIPDFIPVIGYADDAILVALTLRAVLARAGEQRIAHHWTGSADGLSAVLWLATRGGRKSVGS